MPSAEMRASCCTRGTRLTGGRRGPALVTNVMYSTPAERLTRSSKCQARPGTRGVGGGAKRPKIPPTLVASAYRATLDTRLLALPRSTGLPAGRGLAVCVLLQSIRRRPGYLVYVWIMSVASCPVLHACLPQACVDQRTSAWKSSDG
jgi:hypothetical protein